MTTHTAIQTIEGGAIAQKIGTMLPADPMINLIERIVLDPNADLDKLERMLAMKERMDEKNAKVAFSQALANSLAAMPPIVKDSTVDFTSEKGRTNYKYETLAGIAKTIDPILSENGLSYRFRTDQANGRVVVTCIISHSAGYSEETSLSGFPDQSGNKNNFQAIGSAVTYLQRYTLKAALGLSVEKDDDGQAAGPRPETVQINDQPESISKNEYQALQDKAQEAGVKVDALCKLAKVDNLRKFRKCDLPSMNRKLDKTIAANAKPLVDAALPY